MAHTSAPPTLFETRRHLALTLPLWATDCLKRAEPALTRTARPLVLYEKRKSAMRIVALDRRAYRSGLFPGQALADAQALCPDALVREIDHDFTRARFEALADWHAYVSPIVSVHTARAAYGDLVIDITGVAHLWGGEEALLAAVAARLARLDVFARAAIAPTVGAAWACAKFVPGTIVTDDSAAALAPLPMAGLRLPDETCEGLAQMGLKTIGQLYSRNRGALEARFGTDVLARLDQALGAREERVIPRLPVPDIEAERRFAEPLAYLEDIERVVADLAQALADRLEARQDGAQAFHLLLFRVDHTLMMLSVNAASATRDPGHIARLFANRIESLREDFDAGFGIDLIRLAASSLTPLASHQHSTLTGADGTENLNQLYDRLSSRLGPLAVTRAHLFNTHIPERAVALEPAVAQTETAPDAIPPMALERPLKLFPAPEPVEVVASVPQGPPITMVWRRLTYRLVRASGPERIGVEWWRPGEGDLTRDYYTAEDSTGRRFWLFREGLYSETGTPRWFVHGVF